MAKTKVATGQVECHLAAWHIAKWSDNKQAETRIRGKGHQVTEKTPGGEEPSVERLRANRAQLLGLYKAAIDEMLAAVRVKLAAGVKPPRSKQPELSTPDNGLPLISDPPLFGGNGPLDHAAMFEPPYGDDAARRRGRFPAEDFPRLSALIEFVRANGDVSPAYPDRAADELLPIEIRFQVESAVNLHLLRHGPVDWNAKSDRAILEPLLRGLFNPRLSLAIVVPIAMTRFSFDRVRLAPDMFIVRMADGLNRARWKMKAYGTSGHDSVLGAASHALVITGWGAENRQHLFLARGLSGFGTEARDLIDSVFAMLRLETGIATGYAQMLWLARGWRTRHHFADPEVFAVGARRYPDTFDDYGWLSDAIPIVDRAQIGRVAASLAEVRRAQDPRLALALRRLNGAMTRDEPADAILDATIGLELLLGDADNQAISWKLRMRAAALIGLDGDRAAMAQISSDVDRVYGLRSTIVHGSNRRKVKADAADPQAGRQLAIDTLRAVMRRILAAPRYLDPLKIDQELMMVPRIEREGLVPRIDDGSPNLPSQ